MAKRRIKKRTHVAAKGAPPAPGNAPKKANDRSPKSMVIRMGASEVGASVTQLVKDVRTMMEPETASRLKERRANKLRDYTTMAGPLGVTHLLLFSRSKAGNINLRLAVSPRGPTLHFRVESYSLCKDVHRSQKRPRGGGKGSGKEFGNPPLLVMNNFSSHSKAEADGPKANGEGDKQIPKHLESLTTTVFQSLFPPINPTTTPLKNIKRVLLLDRETQQPPPSDARHASTETDTDSNPTSYTLTLRHYAIETRTTKSIPKPLRRLDAAQKLPHAGQKRKRGALPNLGKLEDVADYLLDPQAAEGFTSGSESEPETDAEVEVLAPSAVKPPPKHPRHHKQKDDPSDRRRPDGDEAPRVEKKGIQLHELGPRLRLRLTKVEEGLCGGRIMWHSYVEKSVEEVRELERVHEERRAESERRREVQRANVERKRKEAKGKVGDEGVNGEEERFEDEDEEDLWDDALGDDDNDDVEVDAGGIDGLDDEEMDHVDGGEDDGED